MATEGRPAAWDTLAVMHLVDPAWADLIELLVDHGVIDQPDESMPLDEAYGIPVLGEFLLFASSTLASQIPLSVIHMLLKAVLERLAERTVDQDASWSTTKTPKE